MLISLLTYNILFNKALTNFQKVLSEYEPDIVCLQEIETNEKNLKEIEKSGYKLVDFSNSFIKNGKVYGLATFYNPRKLDLVESTSLSLPRSYYEFFLVVLRGVNNPRTVLKTEFIIKKNNKKITNYNLHLTPFGTNGIRLKQIKATLEDMRINQKESVIMAGDFNYTYQRQQFEEIITKCGLKEATENIQYSYEGKFIKLFPIKLKLDYILYKNLTLIKTEKIASRDSDHFPILSEFKF